MDTQTPLATEAMSTQEMEFLAPVEGIVLTHFVVSADVSTSTDFYHGSWVARR